MARPKKENKKEVQITFKATPEFKAALEQMAAREERALAQVIRRALRKEYPTLPE